MNLSRIIPIGLALFISMTLYSKNIYIKFDPACMDRLEYRLNGNMVGNGLISYSLRASDSERILMELGVESIKQVKRMPRGTKTCGKLKVDVLLANAINSGEDKVYIVRKVGKNYIVSRVHLATYIKDSKTQFSMRGNQLDMTYATNDIGLMENDLSKRNSSTKVFFIGSEKYNCSDAYVLKKIPEETCKPYTDLTFLPGIGIVEEKTGVNQLEAEKNILRLEKINNIPLAEYIAMKCSGKTAELAVKYEPKPEPFAEESPKLKPATTTNNQQPATSNQKQPTATSAEIIFPIDYQAPAPEYQPAGSELVYEYDQSQPILETFRPKGVNCKELAYPGVHIVQTTQTLYGISRQYNVTINQLRNWNKMGNKDLIKPCASLYVLPPETVAFNEATNITTGPIPENTVGGDILIEKGNKTAEVLYRNTKNTAPKHNIPVNARRNVNVGAKKESSINPNEIYTNTAKQTEILYPKSGQATTDATTPKGIMTDKGGCNNIAFDGMHIVQKGETLYSIATKNDLTVKQVQQWNNLDEDAKIKPCMSLYIKTPEAVLAAANNKNENSSRNDNYTIPNEEISTGYTNAPKNSNISTNAASLGATDKMWNSGIEYHVVQKGETLIGLSKMYGFTVERFRDINGLGDSNIVRIGQVLRTGNCLCPANAVGPTNNNSKGSDNYSGGNSSSNIKSSNNENSELITEKGEAIERNNNRERSSEYIPVPVPYDYETAQILNKTKESNSSISYRNGRKVHTVQENDTMASIANKYNIPIDLLRKLNKMEKNEIVIPDMKIYLE